MANLNLNEMFQSSSDLNLRMQSVTQRLYYNLLFFTDHKIYF